MVDVSAGFPKTVARGFFNRNPLHYDTINYLRIYGPIYCGLLLYTGFLSRSGKALNYGPPI